VKSSGNILNKSGITELAESLEQQADKLEQKGKNE